VVHKRLTKQCKKVVQISQKGAQGISEKGWT